MDEIQKNEKQKDYLLPASIVIAALLVSGAWIYTAGLKNIEPKKSNQAEEKIAPNIENILSVSDNDHIRGDKNAPIKIIEFSDMECPFCKRFHKTMLSVINEYGANGQVAWIYRHFPLEQLHSKAKKSAEASECAAKLGGNSAFWNYLDRYFEITPSNDQIDLAELPKIAESIGLDKARFENCLNSGEFSDKIDAFAQDAVNSGAQGTPYSVIIAKNGKKYEINGAQPYEKVKAIIEEALK
ncbi:MAG: DsbA family protein [Patescibacteria group bacterium]|nr:DsbA family protein [Patescibacteria group bacterium]